MEKERDAQKIDGEENGQAKNVRAAKRNRRLMTMHCDDSHTAGNSSSIIKTAKRKIRFMSIQNGDSNEATKISSNPQGTSVVSTPKRLRFSKKETVNNDKNQRTDCTIDLISTNIKLTNEMLDMKKQLFEKTNKLLQMQQAYHQLVTKYNEVVAENQHLTTVIKDLRQQLFCDDLIDLNADQTSSKPLYYYLVF